MLHLYQPSLNNARHNCKVLLLLQILRGVRHSMFDKLIQSRTAGICASQTRSAEQFAYAFQSSLNFCVRVHPTTSTERWIFDLSGRLARSTLEHSYENM